MGVGPVFILVPKAQDSFGQQQQSTTGKSAIYRLSLR